MQILGCPSCVRIVVNRYGGGKAAYAKPPLAGAETYRQNRVPCEGCKSRTPRNRRESSCCE